MVKSVFKDPLYKTWQQAQNTCLEECNWAESNGTEKNNEERKPINLYTETKEKYPRAEWHQISQ